MRFFPPYLTPNAVPLKHIVSTLGLYYQCLQLKFDTLYFLRVYSLNWMECGIVSLCGHEFESYLCFLFSILIFWYFNSFNGCGKTFRIVYIFCFHPKTWIASLFYVSNILCHSPPLLQRTCVRVTQKLGCMH